MEQVRAKDFILKDVELAPKEKIERNYNKPIKTYEVVYENESDIVVRKKTARTSQLCVIMLSQGQIYIKDEKSDVMFKPTDKEVKNFLRDFRYDFKRNKLQYDLFSWSDNLNDLIEYALKDQYSEEVKILVNNQIYRFQHGLANKLKDSGSDYKWAKNWCNETGISDADTIVNILKNHSEQFGRDVLNNNKQNFIDVVKYGFNVSNFITMVETYNFDIQRLFEYIRDDLKNGQGVEIGGNMSYGDFYDFYKLQKDVYGKIKEKYPDNILSDKTKLIAKRNMLDKIKREMAYNNKEQAFKSVMEATKNLMFSYKDFTLVVPETVQDILDEGQKQKHCVATYVDRIIKGETMVVFVRDKKDIEKPLLTVELHKIEQEVFDDAGVQSTETIWKLMQIKGVGNRMPFDDEIMFFIKWIKKFKLDYSYCNNEGFAKMLNEMFIAIEKEKIAKRLLNKEEEIEEDEEELSPLQENVEE